MAKKSAIAKQKKREKMVARRFKQRQELKAMIKDPNLDEEEKEVLRDKLNKLSPNSSYIRLRNRCSMTGRPRGYLGAYKLSRITFREMASQGLIPGVHKASW